MCCVCVCCSGLKNLITPVLAGLLESNMSKMLSFERFFATIENISKMRVRYSSTTIHTLVKYHQLLLFLSFACPTVPSDQPTGFVPVFSLYIYMYICASSVPK